MENSKIIIVEGAQGCGKTTITDYIRNTLPYTNLYRLCGTSKNTIDGLQNSIIMYDALIEYIKKLQNLNINLLFDRTFFTEEVYCRLKYKDYSFTEKYNNLTNTLNGMSYDIYYITLYLSNTSLFEKRLQRDGKAVTSYAKYNVQSSINQQNVYLNIADEIEKNYKNIKVFKVQTDNSIEDTQQKIKNILQY